MLNIKDFPEWVRRMQGKKHVKERLPALLAGMAGLAFLIRGLGSFAHLCFAGIKKVRHVDKNDTHRSRQQEKQD